MTNSRTTDLQMKPAPVSHIDMRISIPSRAGFLHAGILLLPIYACYFVTLPAVAAADLTDPTGDVTLPNADIVSGSATVFGGMVDLRVQFANTPFPNTATHHLHWFLDLEQYVTTGDNYVSARAFGVEKALGMNVRLFTGTFDECEIDLWSPTLDIDFHSHLWFDPASHTLRLYFPVSKLQDDGIFDYSLLSVFGGSGGANERAPDSGTVTSKATVFAPFHGQLWCPSANDGDHDGVPDTTDACPNSDLSPTVVFGDCDTGVANWVMPNGCTIMDFISPCRENSRNHWRFVVCVARRTAELKAAGLLTKQQRRAILNCAIRSPVGKKARL